MVSPQTVFISFSFLVSFLIFLTENFKQRRTHPCCKNQTRVAGTKKTAVRYCKIKLKNLVNISFFVAIIEQVTPGGEVIFVVKKDLSFGAGLDCDHAVFIKGGLYILSGVRIRSPGGMRYSHRMNKMLD